MAETAKALVFTIEVDAKTGQLQLKQFGDTAQSTFQATAQAAGKAAKETKQSAGSLADDIKAFTGKIAGLSPATLMKGLGIGLAIGAAREVFQQLDEFIVSGQRITGLRNSFETLTARVGETASVMIDTMRPAAQGLITDLDLMRQANNAIILGLPVTAESMAELVDASVRLSRAMGVQANYALESLIIGIGRQSRLWLDNIGIVVDADKAYSDMAKTLGKSADDLTDSERKLAFYNATVDAARTASKGLGQDLFTLGEGWTWLKTKIANVWDSFKGAINNFLWLNELIANSRDLMRTRDLQEGFLPDGVTIDEINERLGTTAETLKKLEEADPGAGLRKLTDEGLRMAEIIFKDTTPEGRKALGLDNPIKTFSEIVNIQKAIRETRDAMNSSFDPTWIGVYSSQLTDLEKRLDSLLNKLNPARTTTRESMAALDSEWLALQMQAKQRPQPFDMIEGGSAKVSPFLQRAPGAQANFFETWHGNLDKDAEANARALEAEAKAFGELMQSYSDGVVGLESMKDASLTLGDALGYVFEQQNRFSTDGVNFIANNQAAVQSLIDYAANAEWAAAKSQLLYDTLGMASDALWDVATGADVSAKSIINAIAKQTFATLTAIAISSVIRGMEQTALGIAALASGNLWASGTHFTAASAFYATATKAGVGAGAALAVGAATANRGGGAGGGSGAGSTAGAPDRATPAAGGRPQVINVYVENALGDMDELARRIGEEVEHASRKSGQS